MRGILRNPVINGVCIGLFTAFYALIFITTSRHADIDGLLRYNQTTDSRLFWIRWNGFLASGHQVYIAYALIAITALVVLISLFRRHPYDEYHTAILIQCLAIAEILTLIIIAGFYLMILADPNGIAAKFTFLIAVHWTTVVFADLVYVLISRWK